MDRTNDRIGTATESEAFARPYDGTCPACKREYRRAVLLEDDGVIRGRLSGDLCLTSEYLFAHSELVVEKPDAEFPTREVGAMGNRREVPVEPRDVSGVRVSAGPDDDGDWIRLPDESE